MTSGQSRNFGVDEVRKSNTKKYTTKICKKGNRYKDCRPIREHRIDKRKSMCNGEKKQENNRKITIMIMTGRLRSPQPYRYCNQTSPAQRGNHYAGNPPC